MLELKLTYAELSYLRTLVLKERSALWYEFSKNFKQDKDVLLTHKGLQKAYKIFCNEKDEGTGDNSICNRILDNIQDIEDNIKKELGRIKK